MVLSCSNHHKPQQHQTITWIQTQLTAGSRQHSAHQIIHELFCENAVACFMTMICQCCCCYHVLIVILFVSNALWHFDKLWVRVFSNVPIVSLHAFLLIKHIFQAMTRKYKQLASPHIGKGPIIHTSQPILIQKTNL